MSVAANDLYLSHGNVATDELPIGRRFDSPHPRSGEARRHGRDPAADSDPTAEKRVIFETALKKPGNGELKRIGVELSQDAVVLRGRVTSFYLKQLAQESIRPFAIGLRIRNRIEVHPSVAAVQ